MATAISKWNRPRVTDAGRSRPRLVGLALVALGLVLATIAFFGNLAAGGAAEPAGVLAWTFGLTTAGFGVIKIGIAVILVGIIAKLWARAGAVQDVLPGLRPSDDRGGPTGAVTSEHGSATRDLPIHTMAKRMWAPMLVMGALAVAVGLVIAFIWSADPIDLGAAAWTQGLQFLGEAFLLAGISFLLGTILWAIRTAGGEAQEGLGVTVKTLAMPGTAKGFLALMILGLVAAITQFVLYVAVAGGSGDPTWLVWLGPLREVALGLLLTGIVLALVTIGNALEFQYSRVRELLTTGR